MLKKVKFYLIYIILLSFVACDNGNKPIIPIKDIQKDKTQIQKINYRPFSYSQNITINWNTVKSIKLSAHDDNNDELSYRIIKGPSHGRINGDVPNLLYTPNTDYFGKDSFSFKVNDGLEYSEPAIVNIDIISLNHVPKVNEQNLSIDNNVSINVILTGGDLDHNELTYEVTKEPLHGKITGLVPNLLYTPHRNYFGKDSFSFKVNDGFVDSKEKNINFMVSKASEWKKYFGEPIDKWGDYPQNYRTSKDITIDKWGNILVVGKKGLYSSSEIIKFDSKGNVLWEKMSSVDSSYSGVTTDNEGNIYVAGISEYSVHHRRKDGIIAKYDKDGNKIWEKISGNFYGDSFNDIKLDNNGNIYIAGTYHFLGDEYGLIIKFDSEGDILWRKEVRGNWNRLSFSSFSIDRNTNIYAVGREYNYTSSTDGHIYTGVVVKFDNTGNIIWHKVMKGYRGDGAFNDVELDKIGNLYVAGRLSNNIGLMKLNSNGDILWDKTDSNYDGHGHYLLNVTIDSSGDFYAFGSVLLKFDSSGNIIWEKNIYSARYGVLDSYDNFYLVYNSFLTKY